MPNKRAGGHIFQNDNKQAGALSTLEMGRGPHVPNNKYLHLEKARSTISLGRI